MRSIKLFAAVCAALILSLPPLSAALAQEAEVWTLKRCLEMADARAPEVLMGQQRLAASQLDLDDAGVRFLPDLRLRAGVDVTEGARTEALTYQLVVSDILEGYKKFFDGRLAEINHAISDLGLKRARAWLSFRVADQYLRLMAGQKQARLAADTLRLNQDRRTVLATYFSRGLVGELDLRKAELEVRRQEMTIKDLEDRNRLTGLRLRGLMGLDPGEPPQRLAADPDQSFDEALAAMADLDAPPSADENYDPDVVAIREVNDHVAADPRVEPVLLNVGDGLLMARKR